MDKIQALEEYVKTLEGYIAEIETSGTGAVNDVQVNGTSVVSGGVASVSVPTLTSDLTNDSNYVADASYTHTDNNYTTTEKNKLAGIASGAEANVQADWNQSDSTADNYIKNKPTLPNISVGYISGNAIIAAPDTKYSYSGGSEYTGVFLFTVPSSATQSESANKTVSSVKIGTNTINISSRTFNTAGLYSAYVSDNVLSNVERIQAPPITDVTVGGTSVVSGGVAAVPAIPTPISSATATLTTAGWSGGQQTVSVTGVTASNTVIVSPAPTSYTAYGSSGVYCSAQASGTLTFTCASTPSVALTVNVLIMD